MKQTILRHAEELRRLREAVHDTFAHRMEDREAHDKWKRAREEFHQRYDELAFPGGFSDALDRLGGGDMTTAETAIYYLEVHPYFFRSQYNATTLMRRLKKFKLRVDLQERFDRVRMADRERKLQRRKMGNSGK